MGTIVQAQLYTFSSFSSRKALYRLKSCQKSPIGGKNGENCFTKKNARTKKKVFLDCTGQKLLRTAEKS